jgi:hypothetical protein
MRPARMVAARRMSDTVPCPIRTSTTDIHDRQLQRGRAITPVGRQDSRETAESATFGYSLRNTLRYKSGM